MRIALSRVHFPVSTLGPGRRLGLWLQGCSIRCPGCVSADTWAFREPDLTIDALLERLRPWLDQAEGITISGGEPFDQPDALRALLRALKQHSNVDILVYSGHSFERLYPRLADTEGLIDALISDPYDEAQTQTRMLRGSDNQRLHCLTALGQERFGAYRDAPLGTGRALDVMFDDDGSVWLAGVPRRDDMHKLRALLAEQGHHIAVSVDSARHLREPREP